MNVEQFSDSWIGVIGTISGGLLVGAFALLSKYIDKITEAKSLTRLKLEELHLLLNSFYYLTQDVCDLAHRSEAPRTGPRSNAEKYRKILFEPLSRMNTLQNLYAPELGPLFENLSILTSDFVFLATRLSQEKDIDNRELNKVYSDLTQIHGSILDELENLMFRSRLIPNQSVTAFFKASLSHRFRRVMSLFRGKSNELNQTQVRD